jgi:DNA-binding response OmpR family regulator
MNEPIQILVVDDDPIAREMLSRYLSGQGYRVLEAADATALRTLLADEAPHVLLLDVHMPGEDGLSLARYVREHFDIGIIMVSGAGETLDRIIGLEVGVLRRYQKPAVSAPVAAEPLANRRVALGACTLDLDAQRLTGASGANIPITNAEFELLKIFVERPNRPLTRDQILTLTQNREWDPLDRSIDIRIARLRRKLEPDPGKPQMIKTVRGVGYMLVPVLD